jgi:hypothetical protein
MSPTIHVEDRTIPLRHAPEDGPVSTEGKAPSFAKRAGAWIGALAGPAAIGAAVGLLTRSKRAGAIAGGATALALAAVRTQLERMFTVEPDYDVHRSVGPLELRLYTPRIEARTRVDANTFDGALDEGYGRLCSYLHGANASHEKLRRVTPVVVGREGGYYVGMAMPPGRTIDTLPRPDHDRVRLHHVPARRVAVMCFSGGMSHDRAVDHEREVLRRVRDAGLHPIGIPVHAVFDPPWTLPFLRRNEVWVELGL